jgi:hypothetical protein
MAIPDYEKVDADRIFGICTNVTNAAKETYKTVSDVKFRPDGVFNDAIIAADRMCLGLIKDNPNHRMRPLFYSTAEYNNGDQITDYRLGNVSIKPSAGTYKFGKLVEPDTVTRYQDDVLALESKNGYYSIAESTIYFTPADGKAKVDILLLTESGTDLFTPVEYELGVASAVLMIVFPIDGAFVEAADHFFTVWKAISALMFAGAPGSQFPSLNP